MKRNSQGNGEKKKEKQKTRFKKGRNKRQWEKIKAIKRKCGRYNRKTMQKCQRKQRTNFVQCKKIFNSILCHCYYDRSLIN